MWRFILFIFTSVSLTAAQNGRTSGHQDHSGHGWDIRLAVPGEPGRDYPTLGSIPRTTFSCSGKEPGYYADLETNCQVFRVCTVGSTYGFQSFLCPNGTLFNQAVFVCDWWMNVNCQQSQLLFNNNNEKFGNLRLGPQLMKDIKKMLTHPMRNPYDKTAMKSNLVVMQDYKAPSGQIFPNGALITGPEKPPNNIYIPAKQIQPPVFDTNDIAFAASTLSPRYIPAAFTTSQQTSERDAEIFQRQRHQNQYVQNNRQQSPQIRQHKTNFANGHSGQFSQANLIPNLLYSQPTQNYNSPNLQYGQKLLGNMRPTQSFSTQNIQSGQLKQQRPTNSNHKQNPARLTKGKQAEYSISYTKQQYDSNQGKQPYTYKQPEQPFPNEVKQNLVSENNDIPSTVITKTLTLKRIIQDAKNGTPKSRITVKTWIVKPSKSAKLIQSTPYTYERPTQQLTQKLINTTPYSYTYNKPTTQAQKIISRVDEPYVYNKPTLAAKQVDSETVKPYVYNKPTPTAAKQIVSEADEPYFYSKPTIAARQMASVEEGPYIYNKPTAPAKQIVSTTKEPTRIISTVITPQSTLSRLYQSPPTARPTLSSRLYLPPTTYNPSSRLYLPPSLAPVTLSRQYLVPSAIQELPGYQSEQLIASPTTPSPTYALPVPNHSDSPSYANQEETDHDRSHRNLTFTDILTKQRLDNTVNNIVKDTSQILNTAPPIQFEQFRDVNSIDYPDESYLPPQSSTDSGEKLTSLTPTTPPKSARLVASPSVDLEPPVETFNNSKNTNQFSHLPFYKESLAPTNTIERSVSLKISIPEKIATYLFKNHNDSEFDKLEILNTGSSNYLVLTNNYNMNKNTNFIPIGKLISDKPSNISNSQALVFSLLADSINVAKEYNLAQKRIGQSSSRTQIENVDNDELDQITNKISQLTSLQFSGSNQDNYKSANLVGTSPPINNNQGYQYNKPAKNHLSRNQYERLQSDQDTVRTNPNQTLSRYKTGTNPEVENNSKQIYSGQLYQLPVPDVTRQIYNRPNTPSQNNVNTHNMQQNQQSEEINNLENSNNAKASKEEVEIVKSYSMPLAPAARLEVAPTSELDHLSSQENFNKFISSNTGISAQLQDKIVGTIPHPLEDNKFVTYKKDESYYVYTKLDDIIAQTIQNQRKHNNVGSQQSAKLIQGNDLPNIVAFQLIPSVSYQLEDQREQQKLLNAFQLDDFGNPKEKVNLIDNSNQPILTSNIDYSVDHTLGTKETNGQYNEVSSLYSGPSSYLAPQATVGRLGSRQDFTSRLELEDNSNGYVKANPSPQFTFK